MNLTKTRVLAASYFKLPVQASYSVTINEKEMVLFKLTNGEVYAVENRSPHPKGGVLAGGLVSGQYVYCPLYDWKISLADGKVQAPDVGEVRTFEVIVEDDEVYIVV
ncbi:nitrite reductase small subunit NirD [Bacillus sp. MRMR6]|uniref:nitrite reductase small subunit NirD n=1 Tax=Bacillus sp. MRMR6 TaxID=1928617 RepID=UPI0009524C02|nr:nitrite reductase small subunit NirD [Bacillus sp. MRMR6]OLS40887.1 nitrite reductase [Bacillus sp. MRMR6]